MTQQDRYARWARGENEHIRQRYAVITKLDELNRRLRYLGDGSRTPQMFAEWREGGEFEHAWRDQASEDLYVLMRRVEVLIRELR